MGTCSCLTQAGLGTGGTPQRATTLRGCRGGAEARGGLSGAQDLAPHLWDNREGVLPRDQTRQERKCPVKAPLRGCHYRTPVIRACPGQCLPLGWGPRLPAARPLRPSLPTGLSWEECKQRCPPGIVPACHNSEDTVTISGPQVGPGRRGSSPSPFPVPRGQLCVGNQSHSSSP